MQKYILHFHYFFTLISCGFRNSCRINQGHTANILLCLKIFSIKNSKFFNWLNDVQCGIYPTFGYRLVCKYSFDGEI